MGGQGAGGVVHPGEVRLPGGVVDEERHDQDDRVGVGDSLGVVGGGAQSAVASGGTQRGELLGQMGLTGEGLGSGVDGLDDGGVDIDSDDLVALVCVLDGQRQSDLAQGDDGDGAYGLVLPTDQAEAQVDAQVAARVAALRMIRRLPCPHARLGPHGPHRPHGHVRFRIPASPDVSDVDPWVHEHPVTQSAVSGAVPSVAAAGTEGRRC